LKKNNQKYVSVVIPLLNEEESLQELYDKLAEVLKSLNESYEIIFIDDGSSDNSFKVLSDIAEKDNNVKVIKFQKNYGKAAGLSTGFAEADGSYIVTMDADLQDDPEEIPVILEQLKSGYDLISGWKKKRHDPISKRFPSKVWNFVISKTTGIKLHDFNCGLKGYRAEVVKNINIYGELHRYIPALAEEAGFIHIGEVPVKHHKRKYGKTKYGTARFFKGIFDLLTITYVYKYILRPLHFFGILGLISSFFGFGIMLYLAILKFTLGIGLSERPLLFLGMLLFILGIQLISTGFLGEMITYSRKKEEHYIIRDYLNKNGD
jgi:glycosyltransferase involved in cell wall biosynthesis